MAALPTSFSEPGARSPEPGLILTLEEARRRCCRRGFDLDLTDEIVQSLALVLVEQPQLHSRAQGRWLETFIRYSSHRFLLRNSRWRVLAEEPSSPSHEEPPDVPSLQQLPETMRRALELRYLLGMNCREAAAQLGVSCTALRTLCTRAKARLRKDSPVFCNKHTDSLHT